MCDLYPPSTGQKNPYEQENLQHAHTIIVSVVAAIMLCLPSECMLHKLQRQKLLYKQRETKGIWDHKHLEAIKAYAPY